MPAKIQMRKMGTMLDHHPETADSFTFLLLGFRLFDTPEKALAMEIGRVCDYVKNAERQISMVQRQKGAHCESSDVDHSEPI